MSLTGTGGLARLIFYWPVGNFSPLTVDVLISTIFSLREGLSFAR